MSSFGRSGLYHAVIAVRDISETTYIVQFERNGLHFQPGHHISVGIKGHVSNMREYSIYSSITDDFLEILVKEVPTGYLSPRMRHLKPGALLQVEGPFGFFFLDEAMRNKSLYFIATGTGIAPFHCFTRSIEGLDYILLHGIRSTQEQYEYEHYDATRIISCVSQVHNNGHWYHGRVSSYLQEHKPQAQAVFFLCGNCDMIYTVYDILYGYGIDTEHIFAEVYF